MFSISNTTLAIYKILLNSHKFLTLFGSPTALTYVHIHTQLHSDSPADRGPSPPEIPLMHPLGRRHPRETPKMGVSVCCPCTAGPAVQVAPYNLVLTLFHMHKV